MPIFYTNLWWQTIVIISLRWTTAHRKQGKSLSQATVTCSSQRSLRWKWNQSALAVVHCNCTYYHSRFWLLKLINMRPEVSKRIGVILDKLDTRMTWDLIRSFIMYCSHDERTKSCSDQRNLVLFGKLLQKAGRMSTSIVLQC